MDLDVDLANNGWSENQINFDSKINYIEDGLTTISLVPGVGIISAAAQAVLGVVQVVTATAIGASTFLFGTDNNHLLRKHCWVHFVNGWANVSNIFKGIPLFGTFYIGCVWENAKRLNSYSVKVLTGYEYKEVSYPSLVQRDWKIGGTNLKDIQKAKLAYEEMLTQKASSKLSLQERMDLAQQAIYDTISMESLMKDREIDNNYQDFYNTIIFARLK